MDRGAWQATVHAKRKRRLDSLEAAQGAPRDPRRDSRGERSPWLPLETRPDSPGALWMKALHEGALATLWVKAQHEGALPPPCIVRKDPRVPHLGKMRPLPATASQGKSPVPP